MFRPATLATDGAVYITFNRDAKRNRTQSLPPGYKTFENVLKSAASAQVCQSPPLSATHITSGPLPPRSKGFIESVQNEIDQLESTISCPLTQRNLLWIRILSARKLASSDMAFLLRNGVKTFTTTTDIDLDELSDKLAQIAQMQIDVSELDDAKATVAILLDCPLFDHKRFLVLQKCFHLYIQLEERQQTLSLLAKIREHLDNYLVHPLVCIQTKIHYLCQYIQMKCQLNDQEGAQNDLQRVSKMLQSIKDHLKLLYDVEIEFQVGPLLCLEETIPQLTAEWNEQVNLHGLATVFLLCDFFRNHERSEDMLTVAEEIANLLTDQQNQSVAKDVIAKAKITKVEERAFSVSEYEEPSTPFASVADSSDPPYAIAFRLLCQFAIFEIKLNRPDKAKKIQECAMLLGGSLLFPENLAAVIIDITKTRHVMNEIPCLVQALKHEVEYSHKIRKPEEKILYLETFANAQALTDPSSAEENRSKAVAIRYSQGLIHPNEFDRELYIKMIDEFIASTHVLRNKSKISNDDISQAEQALAQADRYLLKLQDCLFPEEKNCDDEDETLFDSGLHASLHRLFSEKLLLLLNSHLDIGDDHGARTLLTSVTQEIRLKGGYQFLNVAALYAFVKGQILLGFDESVDRMLSETKCVERNELVLESIAITKVEMNLLQEANVAAKKLYAFRLHVTPDDIQGTIYRHISTLYQMLDSLPQITRVPNFPEIFEHAKLQDIVKN